MESPDNSDRKSLFIWFAVVFMALAISLFLYVNAANAAEACLTTKLDANGSFQWDAVYDSSCVTPALAVDENSQVFIVQQSAMVRYRSDGSVEWEHAFPVSTYLTHAFTNADSDLFVAGSQRPPEQEGDQIDLARYDSAGNLVWRVNRSVDSGWLADAELDSADNLFAGATVTNPDGYMSCIVIKISASGEEEWTASYDIPDVDCRTRAVAFGPEGILLLVANVRDGENSVTLQLDSDGGEVWSAEESGFDVRDVAAGGDGKVLVAGVKNGSFHLIAYDAVGVVEWTADWIGPGGLFSDQPIAVGLDSNGNAVVTGVFYDYESDSPGFATIKYTPDGEEEWVLLLAGSSDYEPGGMSIDSDDNILVGGTQYMEVLPPNYFVVVKWGSAGSELWETYHSGSNSDPRAFSAMAIDAAGSVYLTGEVDVLDDDTGSDDDTIIDDDSSSDDDTFVDDDTSDDDDQSSTDDDDSDSAGCGC